MSITFLLKSKKSNDFFLHFQILEAYHLKSVVRTASHYEGSFSPVTNDDIGDVEGADPLEHFDQFKIVIVEVDLGVEAVLRKEYLAVPGVSVEAAEASSFRNDVFSGLGISIVDAESVALQKGDFVIFE